MNKGQIDMYLTALEGMLQKIFYAANILVVVL